MGNHRSPQAANLADLRRRKLAVAAPRDARHRSGRSHSSIGGAQRSESGAATRYLAISGRSGNHAGESLSVAGYEAGTCWTPLEIEGLLTSRWSGPATPAAQRQVVRQIA